MVDSSPVYKELEDLKQQNKRLQERLKSSMASAGQRPAMGADHEKEVMAEVEGNSIVKNHILALNGQIGELDIQYGVLLILIV